MGSPGEQVEVPPLVIHWMNRDRSDDLKDMTVVGWDKDSVLADTTHRQPMIERIKVPEGVEPTATWEEYSLAAADDAVFPGAARTVDLFSETTIQLIMTGANDVALDIVKGWVFRHGLLIDGIIMRPEGCYVSNADIKVAWIKQLLRSGVHLELFLEDWDECARKIYQETGVPVLGINPFYPELSKEASGPFVPYPQAMERG